MVVPKVNYLAVLLAVVASMVVGFAFYHPRVLGTRWQRAVGHTEETMARGGSAAVCAVPLVGSAVTAPVLAGAAWLAQEFYGGGFVVNSVVTALILWLGFTAARYVVHDAFEPRRFAATGFTLLNELLTVLAMALVIGLLPPG